MKIQRLDDQDLEALHFLQLLGEDPTTIAGSNCFVAVHDVERGNRSNGRPIAPRKHWHEENQKRIPIIAEMREANLKGYGIFLTVNRVDVSRDPKHPQTGAQRHRTKLMVTECRALFADDDVKRDTPRADWPIPPSMVVQSSTGKFHYYWLTSTNDLADWEKTMRGLAEKFGTDANVCDLSRIMRIPGFAHMKGKPEWSFLLDKSGYKYSWDEITKAFPDKLEKRSHSKNTNLENRSTENHKPSTREEARANIAANRLFHSSCLFLANSDRALGKSQEYTLGFLRTIMSEVKDLAHQDPDTSWDKVYSQLPDYISDVWGRSDWEKSKTEDSVEDAVPIPSGLKSVNTYAPKFPKGWSRKLPEPWPMIVDNWERVPRKPNETIMTPTLLAAHAFILDGRYLTGHGKMPNSLSLVLAPTGIGKDANTYDVIREMHRLLVRAHLDMDTDLLPVMNYAPMAARSQTIASDTGFMQQFYDNKTGDLKTNKLFHLNTEAASFFESIGRRQAIAAVADLQFIMNDIYDGKDVRGKTKAQGSLDSLKNPNIQFQLMSQPQVIADSIHAKMLDNGLIGRVAVSFSDDSERPNPFAKPKPEADLDEDFLTFNLWPGWNNEIKPEMIDLTSEDLIKAERFIMPILQSEGVNDETYAILQRTVASVEKYYAVVVGICQMWDKMRGVSIRTTEEIPFSLMHPYLEYLIECKKHLIFTVIDDAVDPIKDWVVSLLAERIGSNGRMHDRKNEMIAKEHSVLPLVSVTGQLKTIAGKRLRDQMQNRHDAKQIEFRVLRTIDNLVEQGLLTQKLIKAAGSQRGTKCVGFTAEGVNMLLSN